MNPKYNSPNAEELLKGLDIIDLEERLEMVHLSAVEAEASWKCDPGSGGSSETLEESGSDGGGHSGGGGGGGGGGSW